MGIGNVTNGKKCPRNRPTKKLKSTNHACRHQLVTAMDDVDNSHHDNPTKNATNGTIRNEAKKVWRQTVVHVKKRTPTTPLPTFRPAHPPLDAGTRDACWNDQPPPRSPQKKNEMKNKKNQREIESDERNRDGGEEGMKDEWDSRTRTPLYPKKKKKKKKGNPHSNSIQVMSIPYSSSSLKAIECDGP